MTVINILVIVFIIALGAMHFDYRNWQHFFANAEGNSPAAGTMAGTIAPAISPRPSSFYYLFLFFFCTYFLTATHNYIICSGGGCLLFVYRFWLGDDVGRRGAQPEARLALGNCSHACDCHVTLRRCLHRFDPIFLEIPPISLSISSLSLPFYEKCASPHS